MKSGRVLLVDHDQETTYRLRSHLKEAGFSFCHAPTAGAALAALISQDPDVIVTEWLLRDYKGTEFLEELRAMSRVPVVVLTAFNDGKMAVRALQAGADDVLFKPCNLEELVLRLRVQVRRYIPDAREALPVVQAGPLVVDPNHKHVEKDGQHVHLSPTEFRLLHVLAQNKGHAMTRQEILWRVWGRECFHDNSQVSLYIFYLRKRLEADPRHPRLIQSSKKRGSLSYQYWLADEVTNAV